MSHPADHTMLATRYAKGKTSRRSSGRRMVIVALNQMYLSDVQETFLPFSYGARRIQTALSAPPIPGAHVVMLETRTLDPEETADEICALEPDVVGFSAYLWSFPTFLHAAAIVRERLPQATIVFGGPSSRPVMVDHPVFAFARSIIDALVIREGEQVSRALLLTEDRSFDGLSKIPGLVLPKGADTVHGWHSTPSPDLIPMDEIPSPHQLGFVPDKMTANLETFRGCPLACSFCEWGVYEGTNRVFSEEYLVRELEAFKRTNAHGAYLVDAGFSLNRKAFRNLVAAEKQVQFFRTMPLACEVYASNLGDADAQFLSEINVARLGVGLQSFNPDVLKLMQRPFDERKFLRGLEVIKDACGGAAIEVILGLPGDNPDSFKDTIRRCMDLNAGGVHVFHALVLPDGLMSRAPAGANVAFDPYTLKMTSCNTWSEKDLGETMDWLARYTEDAGGMVEESFWRLPLTRAPTGASKLLGVPEIFDIPDNFGEHRLPAPREGAVPVPGFRPVVPVPVATTAEAKPAATETANGSVALDDLHAASEAVLQRSGGRWRVFDATVEHGSIQVRLGLGGNVEMALELFPDSPDKRAFCASGGYSMLYRRAPVEFGKREFKLLAQLIDDLVPLAQAALAADAESRTPAQNAMRSRAGFQAIVR